jgi:1,4-alpha-glucan branching enzyme
VRNFLIANALFWLREFHLDGLRVDAVASNALSRLQPQRGRVDSQRVWRTRKPGSNFSLKELNEVTHRECPGALMIAEESTCLAGGESTGLCRRVGFSISSGTWAGCTTL